MEVITAAVNHVNRELEGRSAMQAETCKKQQLLNLSKGCSHDEGAGAPAPPSSTLGTAPPAQPAFSSDPMHSMKKFYYSHLYSLKL